MILRASRMQGSRLASDAGIAIGPILFIIAVLGILASAIAAGSGSFTTGTSSESNRAKASAMIDIGQNLKIGFDRIVGNGVDFGDVVIDPDNTSDPEDLFSPAGGGIAAPSTTMAANPSGADPDIWYYPLVALPKIGGSSGSRLAVLRVSEGVCDDINEKVNAILAGTNYADDNPVVVDLGGTSLITLAAADFPDKLEGKPVGCFEATPGGTPTAPAGFYFYQVLGIQ